MTPVTIRNISTCHGILIEKFVQLTRLCQSSPEFHLTYELLCTCGYRSHADQHKAFIDGRSKAKPGQSFHNYGLAFDVAPYGRTSKSIFWEDDKAWGIIGGFAEQCGLEWGGSWKKFIDKPHFQIQGFQWEECLDKWNQLNDRNAFDMWVTNRYLINEK